MVTSQRAQGGEGAHPHAGWHAVSLVGIALHPLQVGLHAKHGVAVAGVVRVPVVRVPQPGRRKQLTRVFPLRGMSTIVLEGVGTAGAPLLNAAHGNLGGGVERNGGKGRGDDGGGGLQKGSLATPFGHAVAIWGYSSHSQYG